jgi:DNA-binding transcriptional LysR family regulator
MSMYAKMHSMRPGQASTKDRPRRAALPRQIASWDDVRFFLAIHRAGSLSAAARPLKVTQPTCGRRLAALEASLGLRLFARTPEGLSITPEGQALLEAAVHMEQGAQDFMLRATVTERDLDGVVRIATTELFACSFLVGALQHVREKHPGIRVELVLSNTETDLLRRDADIAVRFGPEASRPNPETLVARRLGDEPFLLYGTDAYLRRRGVPADPNDLSQHEVVAYSGRHPATEWCAKAFRGSTVAISAPSMQVAGAAMSAGLGLGVFPKRAARLFPLLRSLSPVVARGTGWLIVHPDLRHVPRIRVVVDLLVAVYRSDPTTA